jgi:hypothetical protein
VVHLGRERLLVLGGARADVRLLSNPLLFSVLFKRYGDHLTFL